MIILIILALVQACPRAPPKVYKGLGPGSPPGLGGYRIRFRATGIGLEDGILF